MSRIKNIITLGQQTNPSMKGFQYCDACAQRVAFYRLVDNRAICDHCINKFAIPKANDKNLTVTGT